MGGKSKAPPPPDYTGAAEAQAAASKEITEQQTWANRPDQYNPWGSVEWDQAQVWDPATQQYLNRWQQTTSLDPTLQWALDNQMYLQGARSELGGDLMDRAQTEFGQEMDWGQFGDYRGIDEADAVRRSIGDPGEVRNRAEQAIYDRSAARLDPQWERREDDTRSRLQAQGLREGDPAYDRAIDELNMQREDAYQTAMTQSIMGGGEEAARQFGMMGDEAKFGNQALQQDWQNQMGYADYMNNIRQQQMTEEMMKRGFSLNEINALISGQQVAQPNFQGFNQAQRSETPQYMQAANLGYQGALQQHSMDQASNPMNQAFSLGGQLGSAYLMGGMSDRRLKTNISKIGEIDGVNVYSWTYVWGEHSVGVMADEVPWATIEGPGGYAMVDYGRVW